MCDLNQADYVLEQWAKWSLSTNGFPETSAIANLLEVKNSSINQPLPIGVDCVREVGLVIKISEKMIGYSSKGAERWHLLRTLYLQREKGESISKAMKRLNLGVRRADYYDAMEDFSTRLDMVSI